jgi:dolichol kinase
MLTICVIIGYILIGPYGLLVGIVATFVEKIPGIDDNITIPMLTGTLVYLQGYFV